MLQLLLRDASGQELLEAILSSAKTAQAIHGMVLHFWDQQTPDEEDDDDATARIDAGRKQIEGCNFYFDQFFSAHKVMTEALRNWRKVVDAFEALAEDESPSQELADQLARTGAALQDALYTLTDTHHELAIALEGLPDDFQDVMLDIDQVDEAESWEDFPAGDDGSDEEEDEDDTPLTNNAVVTDAAVMITAGHLGCLHAQVHMTFMWISAFAHLLNLSLHPPEPLEPDEEPLDDDFADDWDDFGDEE